jgi:hypothetical protein
MPWYVKLAFVMALAFATVAGTAAVVSHERIWNAKTIACVVIALLVAGGMGAVTYYYHLHENDEMDSGDDADVAMLIPAKPHARAGHRVNRDERSEELNAMSGAKIST